MTVRFVPKASEVVAYTYTACTVKLRAQTIRNGDGVLIPISSLGWPVRELLACNYSPTEPNTPPSYSSIPSQRPCLVFKDSQSFLPSLQDCPDDRGDQSRPRLQQKKGPSGHDIVHHQLPLT